MHLLNIELEASVSQKLGICKSLCDSQLEMGNVPCSDVYDVRSHIHTLHDPSGQLKTGRVFFRHGTCKFFSLGKIECFLVLLLFIFMSIDILLLHTILAVIVGGISWYPIIIKMLSFWWLLASLFQNFVDFLLLRHVQGKSFLGFLQIFFGLHLAFATAFLEISCFCRNQVITCPFGGRMFIP